LSVNRETGRYTQSTRPKCSFNLTETGSNQLREIMKRLQRITGGDKWTKTEAINFAIDFTARSLDAVNKQTLKDDM
jgi:hypothetical protein